MTTNRLVILQAVLLLGLGAVFLLPNIPNQQPAGVELTLPDMLGEWYGKDAPVTEDERGVLGYETQFARKIYSNGRGDELFVSIVLANRDMNTSIHRPERCLPAQGWTIVDSRKVEIPLPSPKGAVMTASRLHNMRPIRANNGQTVNVFNLNYYWFVGYNDLTASHLARNLIDIKDRLLRGYNQRWAYITVAGTITKNLQPFGRSEGEVDESIESFIRQLAPLIHKPSVQYH